MWFNFKRIVVPIIFVLMTVLSIFWLRRIGDTPQGLELVLYKAALANLGFINAHIIRKLAFPYIKFAVEKDWSNNAMIISIYLVMIYVFAMGG